MGRSSRGQSVVIFALMFLVLLGVVGLAIDGTISYVYSVALERGASAAALAGVPYLPAQFNSPPGSNATERALDEAKRNGYDNSDIKHGLVTVTRISDNQLEVTIDQQVPVYIMQALGVQPHTVERSAIAAFRPPISIGQGGNQLGSTFSTLGSGSNFYFLRHKGWNAIKSEGDAYTPNPKDNDSGGSTGTSTDNHIISANNGNESSQVPANLPGEGGYNYNIVVPPGASGEVQVYNAADSPDFAGTHNKCENQTASACNSNGYYFHDEDGHLPCDQAANNSPTPRCTQQEQSTYGATVYTLYKVNDIFLRKNDTLLTQTVVLPIDASNYGANPPTYINVKDGSVITQVYSAGVPVNMRVYHSWDAITNDTGIFGGANDIGTLGAGTGANLIASHTSTCGTPCVTTGGTNGLGAGTYRLRVDLLNYDATTGHIDYNATDGNCTRGGNLPPGGCNTPGINGKYSPTGSHGYAVRVVNPGTGPNVSSASAICSASSVNCSVAAWEDMCVDTPVAGGATPGVIPLFELTNAYVGSTVDIYFFDVGDASGDVDLAMLDPDTNLAKQANGNNAVAQLAAGSGTLQITNLGISRLGPAVQHTSPQGGNIQASAGTDLSASQHGPTYQSWQAGERATSGGNANWQGSWLDFVIPIPTNYSPPAASTGNDFWQMQYGESAGSTANDTFTMVVTARGGPVHLVRS
jgi:Flp pilus assembly protein TadG